MFKMLICPKCKEVHQFKMVKVYTGYHGVTGEYIKSYLAQCNGCGRIIEVKNGKYQKDPLDYLYR